MNASTQYNDLKGTVAADLSDFIGSKHGNNIESYASHFKINTERFKVVGLELDGPSPFFLSFICVDKHQSTNQKEYIVSMSIDLSEEDDDENKCITNTLFKRLHIVLYNKNDNHHSSLPIDSEGTYEDFHQ